MTTQRVKHIIDRLIALGEDPKELEFYLSIFDDMDHEGQQELYISLLEEAVELEELAG